MFICTYQLIYLFLQQTDHKDSKSLWQTTYCIIQTFYINPVTTINSQWMVYDHWHLFWREISMDSVVCVEFLGFFFSTYIILISFSLFSFRPFVLVIASLALQYSGLPRLTCEKEKFASQQKTSSLRNPAVVMEKQISKKISVTD